LLKPGNTHLEIGYGAIDLRSDGGLRYRYRMEGLEGWNDAGTRRTAYYTQLPDGDHRFRVQVFEIDNPGVVKEASVLITQDRHFYFTPWFKAICVLAIFGLSFLIYRLRLHQMRLRFQAVSTERVRLAREMHDTLIQGCVGVAALLEAAQEVDTTDEPLRKNLIAFATEQVRSTIGKTRDAVWALRNSSISQTNIGAICEELVRDGHAESGIPIRCQIQGTPFMVGEDATHELTMTVKEALTNALSHAEATSIHLAVSFREQDLEVEISDNGRGFDPEQAAAMNGHYGLIGMAERVSLLGGSLQIESKVARGTTLRIWVPRRTR
jgi:signal transduction histidine kinase